MNMQPASSADWLDRQISQVREFIARDKKRIAESPGDFSTRLSLDSWQSHMEELQQAMRKVRDGWEDY